MELKPMQKHAKPLYAAALSAVLSATMTGCQFNPDSLNVGGVFPASIESSEVELDGDVAVPSDDDVYTNEFSPKEFCTMDMSAALEAAAHGLCGTDASSSDTVKDDYGNIFYLDEIPIYIHQFSYQDRAFSLVFYHDCYGTPCKSLLEILERYVSADKAMRLDCGYCVKKNGNTVLFLDTDYANDFTPEFFSAVYDEVGI